MRGTNQVHVEIVQILRKNNNISKVVENYFIFYWGRSKLRDTQISGNTSNRRRNTGEGAVGGDKSFCNTYSHTKRSHCNFNHHLHIQYEIII